VALLASIGLGLIEWGYAARWRAAPRGWLACAALTLFVTFWTACGGSSANVIHSPGTPAGAYMLTVTATVTSGSASLKHSTNLGLTVQ